MCVCVFVCEFSLHEETVDFFFVIGQFAWVFPSAHFVAPDLDQGSDS